MSLDGTWTTRNDGDPHAGRPSHADPAWIVEALAHAETVRELPGAAIGSSPCRRFEFRVDPARHADLDTVSVRRPWRLAGETFIDDDGLVRAATWIHLPRHRRRLAAAIQTKPPMWHSVVLWDFGGPPAIELPDADPLDVTPPFAVTLYEMVGTLWRRKRAYERRHGLD